MHEHHPTILSSVDYARLQGLMCTMIGSRTPLASLLRRKLGSAVVMLPSDAGPDLITSGRSVRFRINDRDRDERNLVWHTGRRSDPAVLSLQEPRGLALLGLSVGQSITYEIENGQTESLTVEYVLPDEDQPFLPINEALSALVART